MTEPQLDDLNVNPWIGIVLIYSLIAFILAGYVLINIRNRAASTELNCIEQIKISREREDVLANAVKTLAYENDVLTKAVMDKGDGQ